MAKIQKGDIYYNAIKELMAREGIPEYVWWPIVLQESGGNIGAIGDHETSFGIFQIHGNFSQAERQRLLTDPVYNAKRALALWKARPIDPWEFASTRAPYPSPEFVAYFWIAAQRPAAWTQYQQSKTINADMRRIMQIVTSGGQMSTEGGGPLGGGEVEHVGWMPGFMQTIIDWFSENWVNLLVVVILVPIIILLVYSMVKGG